MQFTPLGAPARACPPIFATLNAPPHGPPSAQSLASAAASREPRSTDRGPCVGNWVGDKGRTRSNHVLTGIPNDSTLIPSQPALGRDSGGGYPVLSCDLPSAAFSMPVPMPNRTPFGFCLVCTDMNTSSSGGPNSGSAEARPLHARRRQSSGSFVGGQSCQHGNNGDPDVRSETFAHQGRWASWPVLGAQAYPRAISWMQSAS